MQIFALHTVSWANGRTGLHLLQIRPMYDRTLYSIVLERNKNSCGMFGELNELVYAYWTDMQGSDIPSATTQLGTTLLQVRHSLICSCALVEILIL